MRDEVRTVNTILYCRRWPETVAFYRDTVGFTPVFQNDWLVEFEVTAEAHLSVADERRTSVKSAGGRGITVTFQVDSVDEMWRRLRARGVAGGEIRQYAWGGRGFFLNDPEGNRLEVWSA